MTASYSDMEVKTAIKAGMCSQDEGLLSVFMWEKQHRSNSGPTWLGEVTPTAWELLHSQAENHIWDEPVETHERWENAFLCECECVCVYTPYKRKVVSQISQVRGTPKPTARPSCRSFLPPRHLRLRRCTSTALYGARKERAPTPPQWHPTSLQGSS